MLIAEPKLILNLDDFLPADGEDEVEFHYAGNTLVIDIFYESNKANEYKKSISFVSAFYFVKGSFPGFAIFRHCDCKKEKDLLLRSSLVEYEKSELIEEISNFRPTNGLKQYGLFLHSVGIALHVIAKSVEISGARSV